MKYSNDQAWRLVDQANINIYCETNTEALIEALEERLPARVKTVREQAYEVAVSVSCKPHWNVLDMANALSDFYEAEMNAPLDKLNEMELAAAVSVYRSTGSMFGADIKALSEFLESIREARKARLKR